MSIQQESSGELEFRRLPTWKQVGLAGICDCQNFYFRVNLSVATTLLCLLFMFIVLLNLDEDFDVDAWAGLANITLACEDLSDGFVAQKISATTSFSYVLAGFFILLLGIYDYSSWTERDALWRETHLLSPGEIQQQRELRNGGLDIPTRRSFISVATANTARTTFSVEHEEIVKRRKYTEYIMGKKGSPALIIRQPLWSLLLSGALIFLGISGLLFHASLTNTAKKMDDFSLWVVISILVAYAWTRYIADGVPIKQCREFQDHPRRSSLISSFVFLTVAAGFDFFFFIYLEDINDRDYIRASLIGAFFLFSLPMFLHYCYNDRRIGSSWTLLISTLACILAGYLLNEFDVPGEALCFPNSFFQAHAAWHFMSAGAVVCLTLFFRSDFYLHDTPIDGENSPRLLSNLVKFDPRVFFSGTVNDGGSVDDNEVIKRRRSKPSDSLSTGRRKRHNISNDENTIEMWFCINCEFRDNSMTDDLTCKRCGSLRPSMDQFIAIPLTSTEKTIQNSGKKTKQNSKISITSGNSASKTKQIRQTTRTRQKSITRTRRPNSATRRVKNNEASANPNVQKMVNVARRNIIRTVNSQGSGSVTGKTVSGTRSSRHISISNGRVEKLYESSSKQKKRS